jgi:hypothetical protein
MTGPRTGAGRANNQVSNPINMSDTIILALITSSTTILSVIITGVINARANRKQNAHISDKVDNYHKEVNGKMAQLLDTTKALGNAEGKAEQKKNPNQ